MRRISPVKAALSVGTVIGFWHFIWATLVGVGWAKPIMDWVLRLHFINLQFSLAPYAATTAVMLILVTFTVGAMFGLAFALVWNWLTIEDEDEAARKTRKAELAH